MFLFVLPLASPPSQVFRRGAAGLEGKDEDEGMFWAIRGKRAEPLWLNEEPMQKRNFKPNGFNQIFSLTDKKIDPEFWAVRGKRFYWPAWWKRNPMNDEDADFWATRG